MGRVKQVIKPAETDRNVTVFTIVKSHEWYSQIGKGIDFADSEAMTADVLPDPVPVMQIVKQTVCHFVVYQSRYYDDAPDNAGYDIHFLIIFQVSAHQQHVDDAGTEITQPSGKVDEDYQ